MKISELLPHGNEIIQGIEQLFIASNDFSFQGLPILKDSLIHNNSKTVSVNILPIYALDQDHKELFGLKGGLPKEEDMWYLVEKASDCPNEETKFMVGSSNFWHKNHFDKQGFMSDYLNSRLKLGEPELEYSGIKFSSIFYKFDIGQKKLIVFVNTKPIDILIDDKIISLPSNLEIHQKDGDSYTIIPVTGMEYKGIFFSKGEGLTLSNDGVLGGLISKGFTAQARNLATNELKTIELPSNLYVRITHDGNAFTRHSESNEQGSNNYQIWKI